MMLGAIGVASGLTLIRLVLPTDFRDQNSAVKRTMTSFETAKPVNNRIFRAAEPPKGSASIQLVRSDYSSMTLIDMNDRGDFLFLVAPPSSPAPRQYVHVFEGKSVRSEPIAPETRWLLTSTGQIIKRTSTGRISPFMNARLGRGLSYFPYNELRFINRFENDGFMTAILYLSEKSGHSFALQRFGPSSKSKILYKSPNALDMLDRSDDGTFWLKQELHPRNSKDFKLIRYKDGVAEEIQMPPSYTAVERFAQTGKTLAATFGNILSDEPIRSFVQAETGWKELPVPKGSVFSYVQKVFNDGLILGFVTDANRDNVKPVIWDGDKVCLLETMRAWPKLGKYSVITNATRRGDIYVRNVLNTESGATENYLLHISRN